MQNITTIHNHGPDTRYLKTVIPVKVTKELNIQAHSVLAWRIIDNNHASVSVITNEKEE